MFASRVATLVAISQNRCLSWGSKTVSGSNRIASTITITVSEGKALRLANNVSTTSYVHDDGSNPARSARLIRIKSGSFCLIGSCNCICSAVKPPPIALAPDGEEEGRADDGAKADEGESIEGERAVRSVDNSPTLLALVILLIPLVMACRGVRRHVKKLKTLPRASRWETTAHLVAQSTSRWSRAWESGKGEEMKSRGA
mmetsp:Transcript_24307/g.43542  ORF Transcript_24307/g.43542 Transcript_24307/m.43542 type:complete len:200 (+) Transcript_24307:678-1277(+)